MDGSLVRRPACVKSLVVESAIVTDRRGLPVPGAVPPPARRVRRPVCALVREARAVSRDAPARPAPLRPGRRSAFDAPAADRLRNAPAADRVRNAPAADRPPNAPVAECPRKAPAAVRLRNAPSAAVVRNASGPGSAGSATLGSGRRCNRSGPAGSAKPWSGRLRNRSGAAGSATLGSAAGCGTAGRGCVRDAVRRPGPRA
ncbi:hypothetical protein GCM10010247_49300 [Streptomyces calvus]|nr:hypothetical protein GCM10010247_49300 [Streptomyces calvus]